MWKVRRKGGHFLGTARSSVKGFPEEIQEVKWGGPVLFQGWKHLVKRRRKDGIHWAETKAQPWEAAQDLLSSGLPSLTAFLLLHILLSHPSSFLAPYLVPRGSPRVHGLPKSIPLSCTEQAHTCEQRKLKAKTPQGALTWGPGPPRQGLLQWDTAPKAVRVALSRQFSLWQVHTNNLLWNLNYLGFLHFSVQVIMRKHLTSRINKITAS